MRSSPSLYEGAFRLETTARPSDMFTAGAMLLAATPPSSKQQEDDSIAEDDDDSLSSPPIDESYKIRIGPTMERHNRGGSLSPPSRSHEGEEEEEEEEREQKQRRRHGDEVQDLSVTSATAQRMVGGEEAMEEDTGRRLHEHGNLHGYHSEESNH
jgi:hypothetical protein